MQMACHYVILILLKFSQVSDTRNFLEIRVHIQRLKEKNITTLGTWVCGHTELEPNELADKHANLATEKAKYCLRQAST